MTKIDEDQARIELCARAGHEVNRAYCLSLGDTSQPPWEEAPEWQKSSARAGARGVLMNPTQEPAEGHEAWMRQKLAEGWKYGLVKDPDRREHPCMMAYADLPAAQKAKDWIFRQVVIETARAFDFGRSPCTCER